MLGGGPLELAPRSVSALRAPGVAVSREVAEVLRDPAIGEKLKALYMEPLGTSPAEFKTHVDAEMKRWTPVIKAREIRIN